MQSLEPECLSSKSNSSTFCVTLDKSLNISESVSSAGKIDLMIVIVKNYKESEVLPHLYDNKYDIFASAGRRHETLESETKDSITHETASSIKFKFP